ncbi:MAG TPA: glycoside hydrolase family 1 protein [Terriglobales bacterium]|nr:glycoside hydrolase family 1 protein [Terriglobales bacterium]
MKRSFPEGFLWGTACAGHQVEGNNTASNWWAWEQLGLVNDGSKSGRACDYWNRYAEDHALMQQHGHSVFRLGVEWARCEPEAGRCDESALAHYRAMLEDVQRRGMRVCLTLNHWVIPQWLAAEGGWLSPRALAHWERFVERIAVGLGELVDLWTTLNEPMVPVLAGYLAGYHPPGERNPIAAARVFTQLLHAHARAYHLLHARAPKSANGGPLQVGVATAYQAVDPYHPHGALRWLEIAVARAIRRFSFEAWDRSLLSGRVAAPYGYGQEVPGLRGSLDWVGVNYYMRISARLGLGTLSNIKAGGYSVPPGIETTEMGWQVYPPGFYQVLMEVARRFHKPIYVTENGCCDSGDELRRRYLLSHLAQVQRAIGDGADVRGYMLWTFVDNFEWREGFAKKFGLIAVDAQDPELRRVPRPSAEMYREVIAANGVTEEIVARYASGALAEV